MKISIKQSNSTSTTLIVVVDKAELTPIRQRVLKRAGKELKIQGFRKGTAPIDVVEKNIDPKSLADDFFNEAIPQLVTEALTKQDIRAVVPPAVSITKFVPYESMELEVIAEYVGSVKMPDYKKMSKSIPAVKNDPEDVNNVLKRIKMDMAERKDVNRASKDGDQVWIDFTGVDAKGAEVPGASGKDYPLILGSNTFIPGFEKNLVGVKKGQELTFTLTFPADYNVKALAKKKVTFTCQVKNVQSLTIPEINDEIAKKIGPYKTKEELLSDIDKQLLLDKQKRAVTEVENEIIQEITDKSEIEIPSSMIAEQVQRLVTDHTQNLLYRGLSYEQWLEAEKTTDEKYRASLEAEALKRLKGGIVLSEIAKQQGLVASEAEIDAMLAQYAAQYASDPQMQQQLKQPEARRDISARILTDKSIEHLKQTIVK